MNAAKYYEVTEQVVLTAPSGAAGVLCAAQGNLGRAVGRPEEGGAGRGRRRDGAEQRRSGSPTRSRSTDRLKTQGLTVTAVDMKPFHDNADKVYAASDLAKAWNKDLLAQTAATR